jgi:hypothetical protein
MKNEPSICLEAATMSNDEWEIVGQSEGLGAFIPGPTKTIVRNKKTGKAREVYHTGDVGEAIRKGQFTDRDMSMFDKT